MLIFFLCSDPKQLDYLEGEDEDDGTVTYSTNGPNPELPDTVKENSTRIRDFVKQGPLGPIEVRNYALDLLEQFIFTDINVSYLIERILHVGTSKRWR